MKRLCLSFCAVILAVSPLISRGEETLVERSKRIISPYKAVFKGLSMSTPIKTSVDGPLLGNGDMGVCLSEVAERGLDDRKMRQVVSGARLWLCKNDFWKLAHDFKTGPSGPRIFGGIDVKFPGLEGGSNTEQNFYDAVTTTTWKRNKDGGRVEMKSWVAASENMLVAELVAFGKEVDVDVNLWVQDGDHSEVTKGEAGAGHWGMRRFSKDVEISTEVACAIRLLGVNGANFKLKPGQPVTLLAALQSKFKSEKPLEDVLARIATMDAEALATLRKKHAVWWQKFWSESFVAIGDPVLEQRYYLSNYVMACASRDPDFPPPLFGIWNTTDTPGWEGDYHLNYNHMAPFYGLYSSNHLAQADPYHAPLLDFRERARWYAKNALNSRGAYYPVGIAPKGIETTRNYPDDGYARPAHFEKEGLFYHQKSNGAYCLVNVAMRWYATYDIAYAKRLYPLVRDIAEFWEDYLKFEDGRYVIYKDSIHERSNNGNDCNSIVSLALVRNALELTIDMSDELGIDAERHEKWRHILDHLSSWTYQEMAIPRLPAEDRSVEKPKVKVFRYTEKGTAWWRNNTLGIQHIYPAGAIGLDSSVEELEASRNTIDVRNGWFDGNGMSSFYPAAVRVGYDPKIILSKLREMIATKAATNGFIKNNPHGVENCSILPNTINEMLCMSRRGVLRLFPVWPKDQDAQFTNLRAWGAFLVSAEIRDGEVQSVKIISEKGRQCIVQNPWPSLDVVVTRKSGLVEVIAGKRVAFATQQNEVIHLAPQR